MTSIPLRAFDPYCAAFETAFGHDIIQMVSHAGPMVKLVLFLLLFFSVVSWAIIFSKAFLYRRVARENAFFAEVFWDTGSFAECHRETKELKYGTAVNLFRTGYSELRRTVKSWSTPVPREGSEQEEPAQQGDYEGRQDFRDGLERSMNSAAIDQMSRLDRAIGFLATTGNTTPFIGLFGTVWGIMQAFRGIGLTGSANLAVVAPGISEALIATAAGLAAAIPAVVAFNHFNQKSMRFRAEMDIFIADMISVAERRLAGEGVRRAARVL
jgi:biopolymer transport protein TolQ